MIQYELQLLLSAVLRLVSFGCEVLRIFILSWVMSKCFYSIFIISIQIEQYLDSFFMWLSIFHRSGISSYDQLL